MDSLIASRQGFGSFVYEKRVERWVVTFFDSSLL